MRIFRAGRRTRGCSYRRKGGVYVITRAAFGCGGFGRLIRVLRGGDCSMDILGAVYGTAGRHRARTRDVTRAISTVVIVNSGRDSGARGLFRVYHGTYGGACCVRALNSLSLGRLKSIRAMNVATKTSAPGGVVRRIRGGIEVVF